MQDCSSTTVNSFPESGEFGQELEKLQPGLETQVTELRDLHRPHPISV